MGFIVKSAFWLASSFSVIAGSANFSIIGAVHPASAPSAAVRLRRLGDS